MRNWLCDVLSQLIEDLRHWPSVPRSICFVGGRLTCRTIPSNSFLFLSCMVLIIPGFPLQCRIHVSSICSAYAEIGLLVLIYCVCSLCLVAIDLPDWPTYELLQVLHLSLYIPLEFVLVLTILSVSCWCIVFVARRAIFKLVCLKRLVIFHISGLWYEKVTHFMFYCAVVVGGVCFFNHQFLLQVVNGLHWISIILGY